MGLLDFFVSNEEKKRRAINEIIRAYRKVLQEEKRERAGVERFRQIEARISYLDGELKKIEGIENKKKIAEELHHLLEEERRISGELIENAHIAEKGTKRQVRAARKLKGAVR